MGSRIRPCQGIKHPCPPPPIYDGKLIGYASGPGPTSLPERYGAVDRSINSVVPFWKRGWGLF
jgi:hypothetical protein